jgi:hypothetical protein
MKRVLLFADVESRRVASFRDVAWITIDSSRDPLVYGDAAPRTFLLRR